MNVFQSTSIKSILKAFISERPRNGRGEISRIAQHLNVSATLVSHVLTGQKTFTTDQGQSVLAYLGLVGLEADYFMFLLQLERAGTVDAQKFWKMKVDEIKLNSLKLAHRLQSEKKLSEQERAIFYSTPLYMMVRLFTSVGEIGKTSQDIAQRFELTALRCAEVLKFLVSSGFCDERNGRYFMGAQTMHLEKTSPHIVRFHTDWRMRALQQSESLSEHELMFTAPISLSKKDFEHLREETILFIKNFLKSVHASPAEEIACLNLDFFWIKK